MNAMGHDVPNMIGVDHRGVAEKITRLVPDYMVMGDKGMARHGRDGDAAARQHAADDDRHRAVRADGMGGMFSVVKVRDDVKRGDYKDPGRYKHPAGTVACEYTGECRSPPAPPGAEGRRQDAATCASPPAATTATDQRR